MPPLLMLLIGVAAGGAALMGALGIYRLGARRAERQAAELNRLNEIGVQLLRAQLNVDDLCELVYSQSRDIIPTSLFQLGLFIGDAYEVKVWVRDGVRLPEQVFLGGARRGIVGWMKRTGHPLLVNDYETERETLPAFPEWEADNPPRSGVFVPLIAGTATIGVMAIQSRRANHFNDEHVRLLTALGNQAASAIRNAQLFEHARHRAEQLNLIGQISAQISAVQPLPDLLRQIVTLTKATFGYYCVSIYIVSEQKQRLEVGASTSEELANQLPHIELGRGLIGWTGSEGQVALANNVADDPRYRQVDVLPETQSEIVLPLKVEGMVLGVLDVQGERVRAFADEDVFLLETLSAQTAVAIEQAQTYAAKVRVGQRLEALARVSQAVVSVLDLDDLLEQVVDLVGETFGYERVHIFVKIEDELVFRAGVGPHSIRWMVESLSVPLDDSGLIPRAARSGEAVLVDDVSQSPDYRAGPYLEDTRSEMVVPIRIANRTLGVIDLQSEEPGVFTDDDLDLMRSLADSVAVAMRNAALYVSERRRRNMADTLREISASVAANLDIEAVLFSIIDGLTLVLTLDSGAILLVEDGADAFTVAAYTGDKPAVIGERLPLEAGDYHDLEAAFMRKYFGLLGAEPSPACISIPLSVQSGLIGFLIAEPAEYAEGSYEIVQTFANQAAIAINNARLYASQQAEAWVTTALLQVAEAVNAQVDVNEALSTVSRLTALLVGVSHCLVLRWDGKSFALSAHYGVDPPVARRWLGVPIPAEDHPYLDLMTVSNSRLGAGPGYMLPLPDPVEEMVEGGAVMGFPLEAMGDPVGLLLVGDLRQFSEDPGERQMKILTGIAHQAATALETSQLQASVAERDRLEREVAVARSIQASFIPQHPPNMPGYSFAASWRAARQVGGDFYDFISLGDGRWGLVMADVADKGIPAALFMAMCRTMLRAVAVDQSSAAATLYRLNTLLLDDNRSDLFVTVFYAIWEATTGKLSYASGGHNPSMLVRGGGQVELLRAQGIALGIIGDIVLEEREAQLAPGDMLVAYTDGVTEAMRVDYTEWGRERFQQALCGAQGGAQTVVDAVLREIDGFVAGAPQNDDLTLWVLKREG